MKTFRGLAMAATLAGVVMSGCVRQKIAFRYTFDVERTKGKATEPNPRLAAGDRYRLRVVADQDCYVYIITKGFDGTYSLLFPQPQERFGESFLRAKSVLLVPSQDLYTVDDQYGMENVHIVVSSIAQGALESLRCSTGLSRDEVLSALMKVEQAYERLTIRHKKVRKDLFIHQTLASRYEFPVLKVKVDLVRD